MELMDSLHNRTILNTRPSSQALELSQRLRLLGAGVVECPLIRIETFDFLTMPMIRQCLMDIDRFDHIITISPNAADCLVEGIHHFWPQVPIGPNFWAVGKTTLKHLQSLNVSVKIPASGADSESLLKEPLLNNVLANKILVVRGEGGRELLRNTLQQRGADVSYLELYRRQPPTQAEMSLLKACYERIDASIITSIAILEHYQQLIASALGELDRLLCCPLVVASPRIAKKAEQYGFRHIKDAKGADIDRIERALIQIFNAY